ncbi:ATP-grasp domain-containing protein [Nocardioides sp. W3-2-3]|uniref:ATP-grasp domain-containing protein n=1 Tax=Nocardioides convexus TaxID=2712224 RepID=UPI002418AC63|nr:ATP-grasp domain-containing protein [Nocardioides convexus]NHA00364.1 ATP-grasp domain-containing protein [Nocardioides convexus]
MLLTSRADRYPGVGEADCEIIRCDTNDDAAVLAAVRAAFADGEVAGVTTTGEFYLEAAAALAAALESAGQPARSSAGLPAQVPDAACARRGRGAPAARGRGLAGGRGAGRGRAGRPALRGEARRRLRVDRGAGLREPGPGRGAGGPAPDALPQRAGAARSLPRPGRGAWSRVPSRASRRSSPMAGGTRSASPARRSRLRRPSSSLRHVFPAPLDDATAAEVTGVVRAALEATGLRHGAAHTEVRLSERGPVVIEINARPAGGMIPEAIRLAGGPDLLLQQPARRGRSPRGGGRRGAASRRHRLRDEPGGG